MKGLSVNLMTIYEDGSIRPRLGTRQQQWWGEGRGKNHREGLRPRKVPELLPAHRVHFREKREVRPESSAGWALGALWINPGFHFLCSDTSTSAAFLTLAGPPLPGWPVPRNSQQLAREHTCQMPTNQSRAHTPATGRALRPSLPTCPDHPGPDTRQLGAAVCPGPTELTHTG